MRNKYLFFILTMSPALNAATDIENSNNPTLNNSDQHGNLNFDGSAALDNISANTITANGKIDALNIKADKITVKGSFVGNNISANTITANGKIDAINIKTNEISVRGFFVGKNIDIKGKSKFCGKLEIIGGSLNNVELCGKKFTMTNVKINGNVQVEKSRSISTSKKWLWLSWRWSADEDENEKIVQILELKGDSIVLGNIVFEEPGEVHLFDSANIQGNIINGKIVDYRNL